MISKVKRIRYNLKQKNKSNLQRLFVHKTEKHIYASIEKDGKILASVSSKNIDPKMGKSYNISGAILVGKMIGEAVLKKNLDKKVYFDRGAYVYHGRIKALAEAAREYLEF